jgi:hypothetical protein
MAAAANNLQRINKRKRSAIYVSAAQMILTDRVLPEFSLGDFKRNQPPACLSATLVR